MEFSCMVVYTHVTKLFAFLLLICLLSVYFEGPAIELKRIEGLESLSSDSRISLLLHLARRHRYVA